MNNAAPVRKPFPILGFISLVLAAIPIVMILAVKLVDFVLPGLISYDLRGFFTISVVYVLAPLAFLVGTAALLQIKRGVLFAVLGMTLAALDALYISWNGWILS
jgi:hypothetical protein